MRCLILFKIDENSQTVYILLLFINSRKPRGLSSGSRHGYDGIQEAWLYVTMHDYSTISLADDDLTAKGYFIGWNQ